MLLVGALGMLALQVLLVLGAYAMRITPEVVNCDRGRQSVSLSVDRAYSDHAEHVFKRELLGCRLWYHGVLGGGGD